MIRVTKNIIILFFLCILAAAAFCIFFDQAVLARKGTIYEVNTKDKLVALTFDDGPSPIWTPQILDELKKNNIKATFFMIGKHVEKYPETAKRVAREGHEIGNHTYLHHVLLYYTNDELRLELTHTDYLIRKITGRTTKLFRPPKAWLTNREKEYIKSLGYKIVLWTLNSKDWVAFFDDKYIVKNLVNHIKPGDIILLHDSGSTFSAEGGNRTNTVKVISRLIKELKPKGYRFVTASELLNNKD